MGHAERQHPTAVPRELGHGDHLRHRVAGVQGLGDLGHGDHLNRVCGLGFKGPGSPEPSMAGMGEWAGGGGPAGGCLPLPLPYPP